MVNWQQIQSNNDPADKYREIANMIQLSNANPQTQLGYVLGKYLGDYMQRGLDNNQSDKLNGNAQQLVRASNSDALTSGINKYIDDHSAVTANQTGNPSTYQFSNPDILGAINEQIQQPVQAAQPTQPVQTQSNNQPSSIDKYTFQNQVLGNLAGNQSASDISQQMASTAQQNNQQISPLLGQQKQANGQTAWQAQQAAEQAQLGQQQKISDIVKMAMAANGSFNGATPNTGAVANLDYIGRNLASKLITAKQAYAAAQNDYNNAANDTEQTKAADTMKEASAAADSIRQSAEAAGINLSQYGADTTLQQASQNLNNDFYTGVKNILGNDLSSDEYYNQIFNQVKKNGGTDRQANMLAGRKAAVYQSQRLSRLSNAFENYGLNQSGSINNIGAQILMQMQQENPNQANGYANMYATPKDDYSVNKQIVLQNNQSNNAYRNEFRINNQKYELNDKTANNDLVRKEHFTQFSANVSVAAKAKLAQIEEAVKNMSIQDQINAKYTAAKNLGLPDSDAKAYALYGSKGNSSQIKQQEKVLNMAGELNSAYAKAKQSLDGKDIDNFVATVAKYQPYMDQSDIDKYVSAEYKLNGDREAAAGNNSTAKKYYGAITTDID